MPFSIDDTLISNLLQGIEQDITTIPAAAMHNIAEILRFSFEQNFLEHGRYDGSTEGINPLSGGSHKWKPLAASTKATYLALGKSGDRTLSRSAGGLAAGIEVAVIGNELSVRNNKKYSAAQQFGVTNTIRITPRSRKFFWAMFFKTKLELYKGLALTKKTTIQVNIPPSPFIVIQQQDLLDIAEEISIARGGV